MPTDTMQYTGELTILTCWCGVVHAVPQSLRERQMRIFHSGGRMTIFCPLGHEHVPSGEPEHKRLERELQRERQRLDQTKAALREEKSMHQTTSNRLRSTKGKVTLLKRRVVNGKCPCCKTKFADLADHMADRHPGYAEQ